MGRHSINSRRIKIHHSYTVDDVARALKVSKGTVRNWLKHGLVALDHRRPILILSSDLRHFLQERRAKAKRPCPPGHIYCLRCRQPKRPGLGMVEYIPCTGTAGNLRGICPDCGALIHRAVAVARLGTAEADFNVSFTEADRHIVERALPTVNCNLKGAPQTC